ncbi:MAG: hypothetical protein QG622_1425 [Actinomycetota bacterium]|nr:hypothetical protein [Actinomycetota bacterium]
MPEPASSVACPSSWWSPPGPPSLAGAVRSLAVMLVAMAITLVPVCSASGAGRSSALFGEAIRPPSASAGDVPAVSVRLPAGLEGEAPYVPQTSCDEEAKPGAVLLGKLLVATYPGTSYGITRACGADGGPSEHYEGRAVDWMVDADDPKEAARAGAFLGWLMATDAAGNRFANARRLGVMYVIWNDAIWGPYRAPGWRPYQDCVTHPSREFRTSCHRDHVHLSLSWAGALGRTSHWSGAVAPTDYGPCRTPGLNWAPRRTGANPSPCPTQPVVRPVEGAPSTLVALVRYSGATAGRGSTGPVVRAVQVALGIFADGVYGPVTADAVAAFRRNAHLPGGNRLDAATWRALLTFVAAVPTSPGSGVLGRRTVGAVGR